MQRLKRELHPADLDFIRGRPEPSEVYPLPFSLGMWVRNHFGRWAGNRRLSRDCGAQHAAFKADDASGVIALREDLIATATPQEMDRARRAWQAHLDLLRREADEQAPRTPPSPPAAAPPAAGRARGTRSRAGIVTRRWGGRCDGRGQPGLLPFIFLFSPLSPPLWSRAAGTCRVPMIGTTRP